MPRKSTSTKDKSNRPSRAGYDWVSDRRVKGGGYWRKKRSRLATVAGAGIGAAKTVAKATASGVAGTVGAIAGTVGANAGSAILGAGLAATTAGLAAMAARARKNGQSPTSPSPQPPGGGKKNAAKATTVAAGAAGAAAAAALMRRKGVQSVNVESPESGIPPGTTAATNPSSSNNRSAFTPASRQGASSSLAETSTAAGAAVLQKRASRNAVTAEEMLLPQSSKSQKGLGTAEQRLLPQSSKNQSGAGAGIADPWEGEVEPTQAVSSKKEETTPEAPGSMALPSASRRLSKAQLKKAISESRDLKSKRKRTETEIEKANNKIELGKSLQKKESDTDKLRGIDYEMIASEKKANLEARLAEIESRQTQLNELLSPKMPSRSSPTPLSSAGAVTPVPKGMEVIEKKKGRKKNNPEEVKTEAPPQPNSPVKTEETVKTKKTKRSIVQRIANAVARKKEEPLATQEAVDKETPKERRRRERAENKKLKQELIEQTGRSASKAMVRNAYKTPLNLVVPGLGDAIEKADKFFGDKSRIEKWAQELEDSGDINVSRREFFRGGKRFVAKQTVAKPKGITQELRRGAELSKDFFDKLVGGGSDELILKGSKNRGLGADRGRRIQLTKQEFERITRDYTNPQRRQLRNFLDFIGFPLP